MKPMLRYNPSTAGEQRALRKKFAMELAVRFCVDADLKRRLKETAQPLFFAVCRVKMREETAGYC